MCFFLCMLLVCWIGGRAAAARNGPFVFGGREGEAKCFGGREREVNILAGEMVCQNCKAS